MLRDDLQLVLTEAACFVDSAVLQVDPNSHNEIASVEISTRCGTGEKGFQYAF